MQKDVGWDMSCGRGVKGHWGNAPVVFGTGMVFMHLFGVLLRMGGWERVGEEKLGVNAVEVYSR